MKTPFVEKDCTFVHAGRTFESGGAFVSDDYLICYPGKNGKVNDWHGNTLGTYRVLSSWRTPRSYVSDRMYSMEVIVNGIRYVGRGAGEGMLLRAKRSTIQPKQR